MRAIHFSRLLYLTCILVIVFPLASCAMLYSKYPQGGMEAEVLSKYNEDPARIAGWTRKQSEPSNIIAGISALLYLHAYEHPYEDAEKNPDSIVAAYVIAILQDLMANKWPPGFSPQDARLEYVLPKPWSQEQFDEARLRCVKSSFSRLTSQVLSGCKIMLAVRPEPDSEWYQLWNQYYMTRR